VLAGAAREGGVAAREEHEVVEIGAGEAVGGPVLEADEASGRQLLPAFIARCRTTRPEDHDSALGGCRGSWHRSRGCS
jgi:hypothetical protein